MFHGMTSTTQEKGTPMNHSSLFIKITPLLLLITLLSGCSGSNQSVKLGVQNAQLTPCPASPNCVSSDALDAEHEIAPIALEGSADEAWTSIHALVSEWPRTQIITDSPGYLHAECRSAVFGFVDDLELHLRPGEGVIAVRSASRVGHSDFGVNRERIEALRTALQKSSVNVNDQ